MNNTQATPLAPFLEGKEIEYHYNREICDFTTIHIGGKVRDILVIRHSDQLIEALTFLAQNKIGYILLGGGSNVVFPDRGENLTVLVNRCSQIRDMGEGLLEVDAGVTIKELMDWNNMHGTGGMEFLAGIPGSLGGAAAVNAGAFGKSISAILEKAHIFSQKEIMETVDRDYFQFQYRESKFKYGKETIVRVYLRYTPGDKDEIKKETASILKYRKENHPAMNHHSAGCFFKNPIVDEKKISAGKLIEASGLKGLDFKDLQVSREHANFLVNNEQASFEDICLFSEDIRRRVQESQGILLEREVIFISPEGKKY